MRLIKIIRAEQQQEAAETQKEKRTQNTMYVQIGTKMVEKPISVSQESY